MMTKKDYVWLADHIKQTHDDSDLIGRVALAKLVGRMARELKQERAAFDVDRFKTACGV